MDATRVSSEVLREDLDTSVCLLNRKDASEGGSRTMTTLFTYIKGIPGISAKATLNSLS